MGYFILNNMKTCTKCKVEKEFSEFSKDKNGKNGYRYNCKECRKKEGKEYRLNNPEVYKKYYLDNKENIREQNKKWCLINKKEINKYYKNKRESDNFFKLKGSIRALIYKVVKRQGYKKTSRTCEILGCSFEEFKQHLESQFTKGMSWDNAGKWHIDHIYPVSRAIDEEHLIKLNHYTNLQPLWAIDNRIKSNKLK